MGRGDMVNPVAGGCKGSICGSRECAQKKGVQPKPHPTKDENLYRNYTLNELPQPQVLFTFGLLNLNPAPSSVST